MTQKLLVGTVGPARGLREEVLVRPHTDRPEERFAPGQTLETATGSRLDVVQLRDIKHRWCLTFSQVDTRQGAEALRGMQLYAERIDESDADAFYDDQLRDCQVVTPAGDRLGTVCAIESGPAQDLLVVDTGSAQVRVPFVKALVPTVDLEQRRVVVTPVAGLFGDDDD